MKLHERLRELRTERGLRLKDVAELTSLSAPWVCDLERGRARIERNGKRPRTKGEYYEIFLHLRRILAPEEARG